MATVGERRIVAVVGAAVADAAAQPLHWIYKKDVLDALVGDKEDVEFWEPSHNPFYRIQTGKHSCYGDQAEVVLKSLAQNKDVNIVDLKDQHYQKFGPESEYENEEVKKFDSKQIPKLSMPISTPWRHGSIKDFLKNYKANKENTGSETDSSIDCVAKIAPVVALYAGRPGLLEKAESVIRVTQDNDTAVTTGLAAARLLEHFILHGRDPDAINKVIGQLSDPGRTWPNDLDKAVAGQMRQVLDKRDVPHVTAVRDEFKMNCGLPGSFQSALHGVLVGTDYMSAVRQTIRAGGCNCSRSALIGACMAAQYGLAAIPESWRQRTIGFKETLKMAEELSKLNE